MAKARRKRVGQKIDRLDTIDKSIFFILPALILFGVFFLAPLGMMLWGSFTSTDFLSSSFIGLKNYLRIFRDRSLSLLFSNTFLYAALLVPVWVGAPVLVALAVIRLSSRLSHAVIVALYIPSFTSGLIMSAFWRWIFHPTSGTANWLLGFMGMGPVMWLGSRITSIIAVVTSLLMANVGFYALILSSAINAIPKSILEAAQIDGASNRQINFKVVLPIISESVVFILSLTLIGALQIWEAIYIMRPVMEASSFMYDVYVTGYIEGRYGLSFAKNIILVVMILLIVWGARRTRRGLSY